MVVLVQLYSTDDGKADRKPSAQPRCLRRPVSAGDSKGSKKTLRSKSVERYLIRGMYAHKY